jgi:peptidase E
VADIVAIGGDAFVPPLVEFLCGLTGRERPQVAFVPTASAEDPAYLVRFYEAFAPAARCSHVAFFPWPRDDLREHVLSQDLVFVSGGNTANMLAVWRVHGFDRVLREAQEAGIVLAGVSAGALCWFEAAVTDSFGPHLEGMRDGLGLLSGSACPHYDVEERRRPVYRRLVAEGFPGGYGIDDHVGVHFRNGTLARVVSARAGATAYRVEAGGETALPADVLPLRSREPVEERGAR